MNAPVLAHQRHGTRTSPVLVLLHPIATCGAIWAPQIAVLAQSFDLLTVDLPGHGASAPLDPPDMAAYARAVLATLDRAGIERVAVAGLSLGGMVAQALALLAPQRLHALVLAHCGARTSPAARELWRSRLAPLEAHGMQSQVSGTLERWFTASFRSASPLTMDWVGAMIRATSSAGYRAAVQAIECLDHLDALGGLPVPTLVISGDADAATPPAMTAALAGRIPGARHVVLEGAPHLSSIEQPVRFTELLGGFVRAHVAR